MSELQIMCFIGTIHPAFDSVESSHAEEIGQ